MTALDVLARALYEAGSNRANPVPYDRLDEVTRDSWTAQAEVVAARMLEAEPPPPDPVFYTVPDPGSLAEALVMVRMAAEQLNHAAGNGGIEETDWQDAVRYLHQLREATDHIGIVTASLTRHAYLTGEHGDQDIDGVGRVKIIRARDRKQWEPREAVFAYLDARMMALEGEVPDPTVVAGWVMDILPATASTSCKVSGLKAVGLDPKAFCEDTPGPIRVELPPRT